MSDDFVTSPGKACQTKTPYGPAVGDFQFSTSQCASACDKKAGCTGFVYYEEEGQNRFCWTCTGSELKPSVVGDKAATYLKLHKATSQTSQPTKTPTAKPTPAPEKKAAPVKKAAPAFEHVNGYQAPLEGKSS